MDRPAAVAGFTRAFSIETARTRRTRASRRIISATAGASVGRMIAVSFTIARARSRTVIPGANAKNLSGGNQRIGPASTFLISRQANLPIIDSEETKPVLIVNA